MSRRRVAFFINTLVRGGTERNVTALCTAMDKSRYEPVVWTLRPGGENEQIVRAAGVEIHCLNRKRSYSPGFALRAAREIARSDADVFHVFLQASMFYVTLARILGRARQPVVYSEATSTVLNPRQQRLREWMVRTQCAGYAANSAASRAFLATHGIPLERIELIPNGHDLRPFDRPLDRDVVRATLGITPEHRLAIFVGRFVDTKRVCDLLEAVARLQATHSPLRVILVGDGPERENLEAQVLRSKLTNVVQFLGMRHDVVDLLRSADMFVFPSEVEGLSNAVIEAALAGLPIVGCDIGGVRDVVANEREALLVSPRDPAALAHAMSRYLDDEELARRHGKAARQQAADSYAIENTLARLYSLYDQVLSHRA